MTQHTTVLFHANCPDGFASALACWLRFGDEAQYLPVQYGQPPPPIPVGHHVMIVDFSYPLAVLDDIARQQFLHGSEKLIVLDHHKSAQEDLAHPHQDHPRPNLIVVFDIEESGATLTWKYLRHGEPVPRFFQYIRDRDLWRWELPHSHEISLVTWSLPRNFEVWNDMVLALEEGEGGYGYQAFLREGIAIKRYADQLVKGQAKGYTMMALAGHTVPVVNTTMLFSEVGDYFCRTLPEIPFCAYYFDRLKDGKRQWGLRGHGKVDLSQIARQFGGGGHADAAGFITEIGWLPPTASPTETRSVAR